jgi:hypothetical protein
MMGGVAFIPLKAGRIGPKTGKQVETRVAILLKVLPIRVNRLARPKKVAQRLCQDQVPPDMANLSE